MFKIRCSAIWKHLKTMRFFIFFIIFIVFIITLSLCLLNVFTNLSTNNCISIFIGLISLLAFSFYSWYKKIDSTNPETKLIVKNFSAIPDDLILLNKYNSAYQIIVISNEILTKKFDMYDWNFEFGVTIIYITNKSDNKSLTLHVVRTIYQKRSNKKSLKLITTFLTPDEKISLIFPNELLTNIFKVYLIDDNRYCRLEKYVFNK